MAENEVPSNRPQENMASGEIRARAAEQRYPTGVPGLDAILGGGLPRGALVLVMGVPGSGKTTLASQIALTAAQAGRTALVLTALSESTSKLLTHLQGYSFYDPAVVGGAAQFFSLQTLLSQGLKKTAEELITEARRVGAEVLMLDGFRGMRSVDVDSAAAREFLYTLGTTLSALNITTVITSETDPRDPSFYPETTTADVILGLHYQLAGVRQYRGIEVIKVRGSAPLPGLHALTLGSEGVHIYPQLEERIAAELLGSDAQTQGAASLAKVTNQSASTLAPFARAQFDLPELDAMLEGGLPRATCTVLAGSLGTGKTLLSLYYSLAGIRNSESIVYVGFREDREQLRQAAAPFSIGPEFDEAIQAGGLLNFLEVPPIKVNADILAERILAELDQTHAHRLVIDSIAELERAILRSLDPGRLEDFLAALLRAIRVRGVTALLLKETDKALAPTLDFSADPLSVLAENMLLLQQVPYRGSLHRILSILKVRLSAHDTTLREFRIAVPNGLEVLEAFESDPGVLAGITTEQERDRSTNRGVSGRRDDQRQS